MTNLVELALVTLVSLSGNFHDGLDNLQKKNYDKAIAAFTQVIKSEPAVQDIKELSILYRAEAFAGKGSKADAMKDAAALLKSSCSDSLKSKAAAIYTAQGGTLKDLRPKESPTEARNKFFALLAANDFTAAKKMISGTLAGLLETVDMAFMPEEGHSILKEFARDANEFVVVSEGINDTNQTATLSIAVDQGKITFILGLVQNEGNWSFSSLEGAESRRGGVRGQHAGAAGNPKNMAALMQLGKALVMYSMDNAEALPAKLEDLKQYLGNSELVWVDPSTGKKEKFLYRNGLKASDSSELMVAASPVATGGKRDVLFLDGSVRSFTEAEFVKEAAKQKWILPSTVKKEDVPKETSAEIVKLIKQLGDNDPKSRNAARKRLKEIGTPALPFLKEHENDSDPEIQTSIRELLK